MVSGDAPAELQPPIPSLEDRPLTGYNSHSCHTSFELFQPLKRLQKSHGRQ